jgi:hypothetical protein
MTMVSLFTVVVVDGIDYVNLGSLNFSYTLHYDIMTSCALFSTCGLTFCFTVHYGKLYPPLSSFFFLFYCFTSTYCLTQKKIKIVFF